MAPRRDDCPTVTTSGPEVKCISQTGFRPRQEHPGGAVAAQADLYLAAIVTVMFFAGCVLVILNRRERSQARKRGNTAPRV